MIYIMSKGVPVSCCISSCVSRLNGCGDNTPGLVSYRILYKECSIKYSFTINRNITWWNANLRFQEERQYISIVSQPAAIVLCSGCWVLYFHGWLHCMLVVLICYGMVDMMKHGCYFCPCSLCHKTSPTAMLPHVTAKFQCTVDICNHFNNRIHVKRAINLNWKLLWPIDYKLFYPWTYTCHSWHCH